MSRIVAIPLQAATTRAWTVDADLLLLSAAATVFGANGVSISSDPSMTGAAIIAAPAASVGIVNDFLLACTVNTQILTANLGIPLSKGQIIYLNGTVGCWVFLLVDQLIIG